MLSRGRPLMPFMSVLKSLTRRSAPQFPPLLFHSPAHSKQNQSAALCHNRGTLLPVFSTTRFRQSSRPSQKSFQFRTADGHHLRVKPNSTQTPARLPTIIVALWLLALPLCTPAAEDGFAPIFNGRTLTGWHISGKTGHSGASKHQSGGKWVVEDGAMIGSQDIPGNGGIVITDEQFGDFEVVLEMNNDFGPDSGLFLRSTEDGKAWQAMIDYHANGNLMGVYGEGIGAKPDVYNFKFLDSVDQIKEVVSPVSPSLPVRPEAWPKFWHHGQWNELRARIVGNPPHI